MGSRARLFLVVLAVCIAAVPAHAAVISATPSPDLLGPIVDPLVDEITDTLDSVLGTDPIISPVEELLESTIGTVDDVVDDVVNPATDPVPPTPIDPVLTTTTLIDITTTTRFLPTTTTSLVVTTTTPPVIQLPRPVLPPEPSPVLPPTSPVIPTAVLSSPAVVPDPAPALLIAPDEVLLVPDQAQGGSWADIFNFVGEVNLGSILAAPLLALEVLLRALASAGEGLLAPGVMLVVLAIVMARDRRILGTKTP